MTRRCPLPDQKGFLKNRHIEENTRLVYDLIQYCKKTKREGILLLIDFEKAFDSIEWSYIDKVLSQYNFGSDFRKWFRIVYTHSQSCVINNGNYSEFFELGRGCRQGDPWSPYIFIIAIEPLAQLLKHDPNVIGIKLGISEIKIGQYADDTFLTLDGSEGSIRRSIDILTNFESISGLKINVDKTQLIKLGKEYEEKICPILNIQYSKTFKLLGINFSVNLGEMEDINFTEKIANIRKIIKLYQWRNLSMAGRITMVKMQILPKLIHLLVVLPSPNQQLMNEINNILLQFIWNNKRPKIQLNTLVQDYKIGGQKMLHFTSFCKAAKLTWVKKLYTSAETNGWILVVKEIFKEKHIPFIFEGNTKKIKSKAKEIQNLFWKEVLNSLTFYREKI